MKIFWYWWYCSRLWYLWKQCQPNVSNVAPNHQYKIVALTLHFHHNESDGVSNHQLHYCLLNHLFRHRSKKTLKLCITGICMGNSLVTSEFTSQRASNVENVSIWWCHHRIVFSICTVIDFDHIADSLAIVLWLLHSLYPTEYTYRKISNIRSPNPKT